MSGAGGVNGMICGTENDKQSSEQIIKSDPKESGLYKFAVNELKRNGYDAESEQFESREFAKSVLELIEVFCTQGHSGMSAPHTIKMFSKLANYDVLSAIDNNPEDWFCVHGNTYQHRIISALFKDGENGKPYYIDAIIWKPRGKNTTFTCNNGANGTLSSKCYVTFPFMPKTFYVDIDEWEVAKDDWEFGNPDEKQLTEALSYYDGMCINNKNKE